MNIIEKNNLTNNLVYAANTINEDPENHKKKALIAGATSLGLGTYGLTKAKNIVPQISPKNKRSVLQALTAFAFPAGIYYAVKNRDSKKDIALGAGISAGGLTAHHLITKSKIPDRTVITNNPKSLITAVLPVAGSLATGVYMANELGEIQKNKYNIQNKTLNKYPILNTLPYVNNI